MINDTLLVGNFVSKSGNFWANNEGYKVGPIHETDQTVGFLTVDPACTLNWMPYTAGNLLPDGVISGGRLPDGSTTYVIKVMNDNGRGSFGYYNAKSQQGYYALRIAGTTRQMELLILL